MLWLEIPHLILLAALFTLGTFFVRCAIRADRISRRRRVAAPSAVRDWPKVTVQIPIRNELNVIERVLRSVMQMRYPSEQLEIQILDDSDDATSLHLNSIVAQHRLQGAPKLEIVRRPNRVGYKAGAMADGLVLASGEFIAIFDSDSIPKPDFLTKVISQFEKDSRIGLVQGRWGFVNRGRSWLTRVQAIILDSLMLVEQPVRFAQGRPFQFNGSGGVWRRRCIETSGGWRAISVTEDLDLSFRALLGGWRFVHLSGVVVDTELPEELSSYRVQQKRWTCGSAQVLRELFFPILGSSRPLGDVMAMFLQLGRRVIFPLIMCITIIAPLIAFSWIPVLVPFGLFFNLSIWAFFVSGFLAILIQGQRLVGRNIGEVLVLCPAVIGLFVGLSLTCSASFFFGLIARHSRFVRTPKNGTEKVRCFYRPEFDIFSLSELATGSAYSFFTYLAMQRGMVFETLFFFCFAISYLMVGGSAIYGFFQPTCSTRLASFAKWVRSWFAFSSDTSKRLTLSANNVLYRRFS